MLTIQDRKGGYRRRAVGVEGEDASRGPRIAEQAERAEHGEPAGSLLYVSTSRARRGGVGGPRRGGSGQKGPWTEMQIRLTVLGPRGGRAARSCDVLVTA